ncbi:MAG: membrane integrity-associated transporter subunit PqiC [Desulfovibrionaceae bacterium]|nr:membrane integrity-associated transporter subunit PqiC [Desulfovibrionaceae bacterium]MBF0512615.1 membrane integrity-associated transporter subunit PqiC [Desulfovibrionaceae bacterium]
MKKISSRQASLAAAFAALILLGAFAPGCSLPGLGSRQHGERRYYMLDPAREAHSVQINAKTVLKVRPFTVSPGFDTREFIYKVGGQRVETDYYNLLFMQPGQAVAQATRKWLDASGLFGHVVDSTSQIEETHALEGNLVALYGDYSDPGAPKAVLEIQYFLLKQTKDDFTVVFQKNYRRETPFDGSAAQNMAEGLQKSLGEVLTALEADLKGVAIK